MLHFLLQMGNDDPKAFDPYGDPEKTGLLWREWKRNFQLYIESKDITDDHRKLSRLLFRAGVEVQKIYDQERVKSLEEESSDGEIISEYLEALRLLDRVFLKQNNEPFQRSIFRRMEQRTDETLAAFLVRLREQAQFCNFGDTEAVEKALKDQIISAGKSDKLRREMLKKERSLREVLQLAQSLENVEQFEKANKRKLEPISVNEVEDKPKKYFPERQGPERKLKGLCWACNRPGHVKGDTSCPAKGKRCMKCNRIGHFSVACKAARKSQRSVQRVRAVEGEDEQELQSEYVFQVGNGKKTMKCQVGGVEIEVLVDSGTRRNLITAEVWEQMKKEGVKTDVMKKGSDIAFKAYGQNSVIPVKGRFKAKVVMNGKSSHQWFYVVERGEMCLLGEDTSVEHGVLRVGAEEKGARDAFPKIKGTMC
jgi:hypothetical protein